MSKKDSNSLLTTKEFKLNYTPPGPVAAAFHKDNSRFRGIMGPVGSGKSVSSCIEMFVRATQRPVGINGLRQSRWLAVRNTGPELETTTIKTWLSWFPENIFGKMNRKPPITHLVRIMDIEMEVIFLALDRDEDVKKLLSLETSGIWLNEARFIQKAILDPATGRTGRFPPKKDMPDTEILEEWMKLYPSFLSREEIILGLKPHDLNEKYTDEQWLNSFKDSESTEEIWKRMQPLKAVLPEETYNLRTGFGWIPWRGIIADTNPPDDVHWWYNLAEEEKPQGFKFFKQPSGLSPEAENIANLPPKYYQDQLAGKTQEYINVFIHGQYGFIKNGQPVYGDNFNEDLHVSKESLKVIPHTIIYAGVDFGLTPCCVFAQKTFEGQWQILYELVTPKDETIPLQVFAKMMKSFIDTNFADHRLVVYGDPAGCGRDQQGETANAIFRKQGITVIPAPTNFLEPRREAVLQPLLRLIKGKPGFLLDKNCKILRKGFNGQYKYRKMHVSGDAKYAQEPDKNMYSHPHDALQYLLCGGGEYKELRTIKNDNAGKAFVNKQWKIF